MCMLLKKFSKNILNIDYILKKQARSLIDIFTDKISKKWSVNIINQYNLCQEILL